MISANALYWIMLTQAIGFNNPKYKKLAKLYHDISFFVNGGEREWRLSGIMNTNNIQKLGTMNKQKANAVLKRCETLGYSVITLDDPEYPECLYNIYAPPAVLYVSGRLPDFDNLLSIGIVGTRSASSYGIDNSYKTGYALSRYNTIIVSGGALGVDCASHRGALAAGGVTVCVRGCGINTNYLGSNEMMRRAITEKGAVVSEYPPDERPNKYYFPARNRIIAALSDGLLVIEAGKHSGSLITADLALEMGKDLFALMGNNTPSNEGSNNRIKEGTAIPVTDFMDILAYYDKSVGDFKSIDFDNILLADIKAVPVKPSKDNSERTAEKEARNKKTDVKADRKIPETKKAETKRTEIEKTKIKKEINLSGDEERVYGFLSFEPIHIDSIAGELKMPVSRVLCALTFLEVKGIVSSLPGRKFVLK